MKRYGLLGKDIDYSFSRKYFSDKFQKEDLDCSYENFDLDELKNLSEQLPLQQIHGFNVTIPYKEEVLRFMDELDPIAEKIKAVNVVKISKDGRLKGYNSDYYGFIESLKPLLHPKISKALILGTGGASKAISFALDELQIEHVFVSRNPDFNELNYKDIDEDIIKDFKLIINCTPLGTYPNIEQAPNLPYELLTKEHVLYDLIYNPELTTFLKHGKEKGSTVANGSKMLILQAEKSWEIWNKV